MISRPSSHLPRGARRGTGGVLPLVCALLLASCDGSNLFTEPVVSGGPTGADKTAPTVQFEQPGDGTATTVAPLDSVFTQFRVQDNRGVAEVKISGFALRGDAGLGNQTEVARFQSKTIRLDSIGRMARDTVLRRFLVSTGDSLPESTVYLVAAAKDSAGNLGADTVTIAIAGPRVQIVSPLADSTVRAGTSLSVRVAAEDRADLITSLRVRTSGAFSRDTTLTLRAPARAVDTVVVLPVPATAQGELQVDASATSGRRLTGTSRTVRMSVLGATADNVPPRVSFSVVAPPRMEVTDSIFVTVTGVDETRVDTLGATVLAVRRSGARDDTLGVVAQRVAVSPPTGTRTLRLSLDALNLSGLDTMTVAFEVVAFAKDGAGNCAAATTPNAVQSLPCRAGYRGATVTEGPGALSVVSMVRGRTVLPPTRGDVIADLVSDGSRVFVSNQSQNRVEVLPIGTLRFSDSILVGSRPWGLGLSADGGTLLVANSGGAGAISRIPVAGGIPRSDAGYRITTANVVLWVVKFSIDQESGRINLDITDQDFSDQPQFLAQTASGHIIYSTVPTSAAPLGTVQDYNPHGVEPSTDLFVEYARGTVEDQFVVRRADFVGRIIQGTGDASTHQLKVCDHAPGQPARSLCFPQSDSERLSFQEIEARLRAAGSDVAFDYNINPSRVGLSDTTFLAVSADRRTVAVGEGVEAIGRVLSFADDGAGNVRMIGDTRDLVNNTADRVVGLALNRDGTVGAARGNNTYFFDRALRKLGDRLVTGAASGGIALHPDHPTTQLGFISGKDAEGRPVIDIVDTFHFRPVRRIYLRDPVVGTLIAVRGTGPVAVRLYAITSAGVVALDLTQADLQ